MKVRYVFYMLLLVICVLIPFPFEFHSNIVSFADTLYSYQIVVCRTKFGLLW